MTKQVKNALDRLASAIGRTEGILREDDDRRHTETTENGSAAFDLAEYADENSASILDLADYVAELEERIINLEGGN